MRSEVKIETHLCEGPGEDVLACTLNKRSRERASGWQCPTRANNGVLFLMISVHLSRADAASYSAKRQGRNRINW